MPPEIRNYPQPIPEKIDAAFNNSIMEAEKSGIPITIAIAKNEYGNWLMSQDQRRYREAAPLFQEVAEFQELQTDKTEAAHTYHMLSSCQFLIGEIDTLSEANESIKKAIEFYPDSEEFTDSKKSAIIMQIAILRNLADRTGNLDYFNQGQEVYRQYASLMINDKDKEVQKELALTGLA